MLKKYFFLSSMLKTVLLNIFFQDPLINMKRAAFT